MIGAAVIGTGFMGPTHIEALRRLGVSVRGVAALTPELARQTVQELNLPIAYEDFQAVLNDPEVKVVHIATPNTLHYDMVRRVLLADKHVICEKPLAMDSKETAELLALSQSKPHLAAVVNYNIRFYPIVLQAREMVRSGALGEVYHVRGAYTQDWLLFDTDWNWRLVPEEGGKLRAIGDIGSHWMDLMYFITGLPVNALMGDLSTLVPVRKKPREAVATFKGKEQAGPSEFEPVQIQTDDYGAVLFHYEGGARGTMCVSQVTAGRKNQLSFEIAGSKAALAWDGEHPNDLWIGHRERPNEILVKDPSLLEGTARTYANYPGGHAEGYPDTFKQLYRAVYGYITAGDFQKPRLFPTFEDGHRVMQLCDAILESHQGRCWVNLR